MYNFRDSNLVTFYFYELTLFLDWMKNTLLFAYSTNILVHLLTVNMKNCLTPIKKSENVLPHSNNSSENATPSSCTFPLTSYKEVHPHPLSGSQVRKLRATSVISEVIDPQLYLCLSKIWNWTTSQIYYFFLEYWKTDTGFQSKAFTESYLNGDTSQYPIHTSFENVSMCLFFWQPSSWFF